MLHDFILLEKNWIYYKESTHKHNYIFIKYNSQTGRSHHVQAPF